MKNKGVGLFLSILCMLFAIAALVFYMVNCRTDYFISFGVDMEIVICLVIGVLLQAINILLGWKSPKAWADIFPVLSSGVLMAAFVQFIGARVNEFASIITFQKNDSTMADLQSALLGIVCCLIAVIISMAAAFFDVSKTSEAEKAAEVWK